MESNFPCSYFALKGKGGDPFKYSRPKKRAQALGCVAQQYLKSLEGMLFKYCNTLTPQTYS